MYRKLTQSFCAIVLMGISNTMLFAEPVTQLTVYTAIEQEFLQDYKQRFEEKNPDIRINWTRDSTGIITAKLLAEKDNPKADIAFGVAITSLLILKDDNLLIPYKPKGYELIAAHMKDTSDTPYWVGINAWATALCINKYEMKKRNLPYPANWEDLTKPEYQGQISMPHPISSGTGFMNLSAWLQQKGEEAGWAYIGKLHKNIKHYTHSGTKACTMAAQGEVAIGLASSSFATQLLNRRAPIELIIPEDGVGWEMEAVAIIKGTSKLEAAQRLMDWASSEEVAEIGQRFSGILAREDLMTAEGKKMSNLLIKNDFVWAAKNRERILSHWRNEFESK